MPPSLPKRERSASANALCHADEPRLKAALVQTEDTSSRALNDPTAPFMSPNPGESMASYFFRLGSKLDAAIFRAAHAFDRDGLYVYKRPVRSASPQHAMLLGQAGTVLNHVVVYCKRAESLVALEYGPANSMDITENLMASAPAGPVLLKEPEHPEPEHLPMLHIDLEHHSLDLDHVVTVLEFAGSKLYQAMHNNCIAFADFIVRALTGNAVKNAPHIFDCVVGKVPPVDSPMLPLVQMMTQLTWHDITDGSRLMREYVQLHGMDAIKPLENAPSVLKADVEAGTGAPAHGKWSVGQSSPASVSEGDSGSSVSTVDEALNAAVDGKMGGTRFGRKGGVPVIPVRPKNRAMNPAPAPTA